MKNHPNSAAREAIELNHTDELRRASMEQLRIYESLRERILDAVIGEKGDEPIKEDA